MNKVHDHASSSEFRTEQGYRYNVAIQKYLGTTVTNQDDIHDEIKSRLRLNSRNSCYYSVQNLLSSRFI